MLPGISPCLLVATPVRLREAADVTGGRARCRAPAESNMPELAEQRRSFVEGNRADGNHGAGSHGLGNVRGRSPHTHAAGLVAFSNCSRRIMRR